MNRENLVYITDNAKKDEMFGFQKFKTMQSFGKHVLNGTLTLDNAIDDSINLEKNRSIISKNLQNQEVMKKKKKKKKN